MPIVVDYGPGAVSLGTAIAQGVMGQNERAVQSQYAQQLLSEAENNRANYQVGQQDRQIRNSEIQQDFSRQLAARQQLFGEYQDAMNRQQHLYDQQYNNYRDQQDFAQQAALQAQHNQQQIDYINAMNDDIGLRQGKLRYDPQQKQELNTLYKARNKLLDDETMHPIDRQNGLAIIDQKLRTIRPTPVTPDEQPVSMADKIGQMIGMWTDPRTGQQYPMTIDRSGVPKPIEFKDQSQQDSKPMSFGDQFRTDADFQRKELEAAKKEIEAERDRAIKSFEKKFAPIPDHLTAPITGNEIAARAQQRIQAMDGARSMLMATPQNQFVNMGNGQVGVVTGSGRVQPVDLSQVPPQVLRQMQQQQMQQLAPQSTPQQQSQQQAPQQNPLQRMIPINVDPKPSGVSRFYDPATHQTVVVQNRSGSMATTPPTANDMRAVDRYVKNPEAAPSQMPHGEHSEIPQQRIPHPQDAATNFDNLTPGEKQAVSPVVPYADKLPWVKESLDAIGKAAHRHGSLSAMPEGAHGVKAMNKVITFAMTLQSPIAYANQRPSAMDDGSVFIVTEKKTGRRVKAVWHDGKFTVLE